MNKFIFSIVVPVYNVEAYLAETIDSLIAQSIGFDKIQVILVNDGSKDNSKKICEEYVKKYPKNIIYVEQKNSGVSEARNNGLSYAKGKYVNFLDSDDCWEEDVFKKVLKMFEENEDLDIIGVRQKLFEAQNGYTSLDYKFKNTPDGVYDIREHYSFIQLSVTSGFFRIEAAKTAKFDSRIKYSEDAKYIYDVMINRKTTKLGLISSSNHLYRKRFSQNSAIQTKDSKRDWYVQTVKLSYKYLYDRCKKEFPEILKTIEQYIMYDYQFRYKMNLDEVDFSKEDREGYIKDTIELIKHIDDEIILSVQFITVLAKQHLLKIKYDSEEKAIKTKLDFQKKYPVYINFNKMDIDGNKLHLDGIVDLLYSKELKLYYYQNGKKHKINFNKDADLFLYNNLFNDRVNKCAFDIIIDLENSNDLKFVAEVSGKEYTLNIAFYGHLNMPKYKFGYKKKESYIIEKKGKNKLIINKKSPTINEIKLLCGLLAKLKINTFRKRISYWIAKQFKKKEIWLISDREDVAGDNGEAFFQYVCKVKPKNVDYYFVIDKKSKDVKRLKEIGPVLYYGTSKFLNKYLLCDKLISSYFDRHVFYPKPINKYLFDLTNYKYIFLQHGVINNDMSSIINKFAYDIKLFITASEKEKDLIVKDDRCGFDETIVKDTGLARYDKLGKVDNKKLKNVILLSPTWRANLCLPNDEYNEGFKETEFYKFYNKLFNDKRLTDVLKKKKYKIRFCLHYRLRNQMKDFTPNKYIELVNNVNYSKEIIESKALCSDYSSLVYDFAYLNKPVLYNRFDVDTFYKGHTYRKIDDDSFILGEVTYNYEDYVNQLIKMIESDCKNPKKYVDKAKKFFRYKDKNNSKRIYEEVLKIK